MSGSRLEESNQVHTCLKYQFSCLNLYFLNFQICWQAENDLGLKTVADVGISIEQLYAIMNR